VDQESEFAAPIYTNRRGELGSKILLPSAAFRRSVVCRFHFRREIRAKPPHPPPRIEAPPGPKISLSLGSAVDEQLYVMLFSDRNIDHATMKFQFQFRNLFAMINSTAIFEFQFCGSECGVVLRHLRIRSKNIFRETELAFFSSSRLRARVYGSEKRCHRAVK
jgi:hypothetical protein